MSRGDDLRLQDIAEAIAAVRSHIADGEFDRKTSDAVLFNLVVVGEAAAQLSDDTRTKVSDIPWGRVIALRNLIAHEYFRVDLDIIRSILAEQLDELEEVVRQLTS